MRTEANICLFLLSQECVLEHFEFNEMRKLQIEKVVNEKKKRV